MLPDHKCIFYSGSKGSTGRKQGPELMECRAELDENTSKKDSQ